MRWRVLQAADATPLGEVRFVPGPPAATEFAPAPGGADWLALVEELVRGDDFMLRLDDGRLVEGPHDQDPARLEAALGLIAQNYPFLAIEAEGGAGLGGGAPPEAPVGVELERALVMDLLEELTANLRPPSHAAEQALRAALTPLLEANDGAQLAAALNGVGGLLDSPQRSELEPLLDLLVAELDRFQRDPTNPPLSELRRFVDAYAARRVDELDAAEPPQPT